MARAVSTKSKKNPELLLEVFVLALDEAARIRGYRLALVRGNQLHEGRPRQKPQNRTGRAIMTIEGGTARCESRHGNAPELSAILKLTSGLPVTCPELTESAGTQEATFGDSSRDPEANT